ncbi:MAG: deoxyguanosinetriphosphate triphosphohydrolase [Verrucomicrobiae bacterium]|nr:deoxyguanosinetriphosphate triphosphohydrolase [Verrucomicrobiae bacterium]
MLQQRLDVETLEACCLAPYAQLSALSRGREHPEPRHELRTEFQRDRARIIHSAAFRRLEYKTQVFLNGTGDHLRTRLTHTMEVASISRTIARALGANEDLAECIALAHDLGHSPFGHAGERMLNSLMKGFGGFDHNLQSLRIVEEIEQKYPGFNGLNLSWEVREGLVKHETAYDTPDYKNKKYFHFPRSSLEAQIANLADEIAYYSHDLEDGLESGLLDEKELHKVALWRQASETVRKLAPKIPAKRRASYIIRTLIDREVMDVIGHSAGLISAAGVLYTDEVRQHKSNLIHYSPALARLNIQLRKHLYTKLYFHPEVRKVHDHTCRIMRELFMHYIKNPRLIGRQSAGRISKNGLYRAVCDYVSGMTDRYLIEQYETLFKTNTGLKI